MNISSSTIEKIITHYAPLYHKNEEALERLKIYIETKHQTKLDKVSLQKKVMRIYEYTKEKSYRWTLVRTDANLRDASEHLCIWLSTKMFAQAFLACRSSLEPKIASGKYHERRHGNA